MSTPPQDDPAHARFRRGARSASPAPGLSPVTPPPPLVGPGSAAPSVSQVSGRPLAVSDLPAPADPAHPAPPPPVITATPPTATARQTPAADAARPAEAAPTTDARFEAPEVPTRYGVQPLFADLLVRGTGDPVEPLYDSPDYEWEAVDDDGGRPLGIVALVVGLFVGVAGLIAGIVSVRRSHRTGHRGAWGIAAIVVSIISLAVGASIGLSYANYAISLAQQCALNGPGVYLTQSGTQVTCR